MPLSSDELDLLNRLKRNQDANFIDDERNLRYYRGLQRVEQLGMAIPPNMRRFLVVVNWPRVVVDTIEHRQNVRALILPGEDTADPQLQSIWDANNLSAHVKMFNRDRLIYGRAFMSVGTNEKNPNLPLIRVESPREMAAIVDVRREVVTAAARFYGGNDDTTASRMQNGEPYGGKTRYATLYLPNATVWVRSDDQTGGWVEVDRDDHNLGVVPVVMHLNRRMSGGWVGESQMSDIIGITDSAARTLTNLQFAIEAHGVPRKFMVGVEQKDFVGEDGKPLPQWEAYFDAIHMVSNPQGKVGQLEAADVTNFANALREYRTEASMATGFPGRYFGLTTTNPPAEGAIRADEGQLVESVEGQNEEVGMTLGWVGALALLFSSGREVEGNQVRVDWFDPATPTQAQRMDALVKMRSVGAISREGMWDELGWSQARKDRERRYLESEANDPVTRAIIDEVSRGAITEPAATVGA